MVKSSWSKKRFQLLIYFINRKSLRRSFIEKWWKMSYKVSFLIYSLIFLCIWILILLLRKDLRRVICLFSLCIIPLGPISELWFLQDYWRRVTITGFSISIEDLIFSFALGGIVISLYPILFRKSIVQSTKYKKHFWMIFLTVCVILICMIIFTNFLKINSIFSSSLGFILVTAVIWFFRRDLIKPSICSGIALVIIFFIVYQIMKVFFPFLFLHWCKQCNPTNIKLLGVNIEELVWDFSWGLLGSILYPAVRGKEYKDLNNNQNTPEFLKNYKRYEKYTSSNKKNEVKSKFSIFIVESSKNILSLRIIGYITFLLSVIKKRKVNELWAIICVSFLPIVINCFLYPFNLATKNVSTFWLCFYSFLIFFLLYFPHYAWNGLIGISDSISNMLKTDRQREVCILWLKHRLNIRNQIWFSAIGSLICVIALFLFSPILSRFINLCATSYLTILITGFLGFNAVYNLWNIPQVIFRIHRFNEFKLFWNNPAGTPGIRNQSRLISICSIFTALGVALFIIPLLWFIFLAQPNEILVAVVNVIAFSASFSTLLFVAFFPQFWIYSIVKREKHIILDQLGQEISQLHQRKAIRRQKWILLEIKTNLYKAIFESSKSVIDTQTLIGYFIAILTSLTPYLIQIYFPK